MISDPGGGGEVGSRSAGRLYAGRVGIMREMEGGTLLLSYNRGTTLGEERRGGGLFQVARKVLCLGISEGVFLAGAGTIWGTKY